jgi:hypothetical protein
MLQSISWFQFGSFLLVTGAAYYGYVLIRFYWKEYTALLRGKGKKATNPSGLDRHGLQEEVQGTRGAVEQGQSIVYGAGGVGASGSAGPSGTSVGGQPELFGAEELTEKTPELFKVMEKVIVLLKGVVSQGMAGGIGREELMYQLKEVMDKYHHLKNTPYEVAVNNFLVRTCSSNFSLLLGEEELKELWN